MTKIIKKMTKKRPKNGPKSPPKMAPRGPPKITKFQKTNRNKTEYIGGHSGCIPRKNTLGNDEREHAEEVDTG